VKEGAIKVLLSRLHLDLNEIEFQQMVKEFHNFEKAESLLKEIDTSGVEPCFSPLEIEIESKINDSYHNDKSVFINTDLVDGYVSIKRVLK